MKKQYSILLSLLFAALAGFSQNTLILPNVSGDAGDTVLVNVSISNADAFYAFQLSLYLHPQLTYVSGSAALAGRETDHSLSAGIITGDSLRLIGYSENGTSFTGNSGAVAQFKLALGAVPGSYDLDPENVLISDSESNNILTGVTDGQVTLLSPDIHLSAGSLNYTRTIVGNTRDLSFTLFNFGNASLSIDSIAASTGSACTVLSGWSSTISGPGSQGITVRFIPPDKGDFTGTVVVYSDDPDEPSLSLTTSGTGYKVNELHVNNLSTRSGKDTTLTFRINNQEPFTGFQLDLPLPSAMTYLDGSEQLTGRANGHTVSANVVSGGKLRIVAYSDDQHVFSGSDGNVAEVGVHVEGTGGSYSLNISDAFITDTTENILSDSFNGQLSIAAGDIQSSTSLNYGSVSILETEDLNLTIQNTGDDTLFVTSISSNNAQFWTDFSAPFFILPSQQSLVATHFHSDSPGAFSGKYTIRSNDPDEDPYYVSFSGTAYSPNTMGMQTATVLNGDYTNIFVDVDNYDPFTAFQCDLVMPSPLSVILDSTRLTSRSRNHSLIKAHITGNQYRFMAYSVEQNTFTGNSGSVLELLCTASGSPGSYTMNVQDAVIGSSSGTGIQSGSSNGTLNLVTEICESKTAVTGTPVLLNQNTNGRHVDFNFTALTGSGQITVQHTLGATAGAPCINVCGFNWLLSKDAGITSFSTDITFHYNPFDMFGYTESSAFLGIAKFNTSTNTWIWLGGTVDPDNNTITVNGVTSFSEFALFRRIFGDVTGDGYVDAADLQRLGDCWHDTNAGEFTSGTDAQFFNFNKNTDGGDQIIDAADLQVFGDCWHNGVAQ